MPQGLMLAVLKDKKAPGVSLKQIPIPHPALEEALVRIKAVSICGTDISIYDWTPWAKNHIKPPKVLGHELVGEIVEVNSKSSKFKKGDLVSSETHIYCGKCSQCRLGNKHICEHMKLFGIGRDGGFAQYATIPIKTAWKNDPGIPLPILVLQEPLGNAVHAVKKTDVRDKVVGVFGLGPIGICSALVAKTYGAKVVFGVEPSSYRRDLAQKMGINKVFPSLPKEYKNSTEVSFEMSGAQAGLDGALDATKPAGFVIIFGIPKSKVKIDFGKYLINKELTLIGVFGRRIWQTWEDVQSLLKKNHLNLAPLITHTFKLSEFEKAIETIKSGNCGKILLIP